MDGTMLSYGRVFMHRQAFCPGACSGHGFCDLGFCRCNEGYYGT